MRVISTIGLILWSLYAVAEIPEWYKRDIASIINGAEGVIIYKVKSVNLESQNSQYFSYKIYTETIEELKGKAPKGQCYFLHSEGEWKSPTKIGETRVVILGIKYTGECGAIDPGFGAPATEDYVSLFKSIINLGT